MLHGFGRTWFVAAFAMSIVVAATGIFAVSKYRSAEATLDRSLREVFRLSRPTSGRLFGAPYAPHISAPTASITLNRAQLLFLTLPEESPASDIFQPHVEIASHQWQNAANTLESLVYQSPEDPGLLNDLGVVYLELGVQDPSYLIQAFTRFVTALDLDPTLVEPAFNLALTYRLLHLTTDEKAAIDVFGSLESESDWFIELTDENLPGTANLSPDIRWESMLNSGLETPEGIPDLSESLKIAELFQTEYQDLTATALLEPLQDQRRERVVELRLQIQRAVAAYQEQRFGESAQMLESIRPDAVTLGSEFDRLWIDLNRAQALTWIPNLAEAERLLDSVVESARSSGFKWLLAESLTAYGGHPRLSDSPQQLIDRLEEAIQLYESIEVRADSTRARFYLATILFAEGNAGESFNLANLGLSMTPKDNHSRLYQHYWITSLNPLLKGSDLAFKYQNETAISAALADRPDGVAYAHMKLAELHQSESRSREADLHMRTAEAAILETESTLLRDLVNIDLTLAKARILAVRGEASAAEQLLMRGLETLTQEGISIFYEQRYRMELARGYSQTGEMDTASKQFSLAIEAVEKEDSTLDSQARLMFDEQRREIYEAAIEFEFGRGEVDAARSYARRYRTKLLTEAVEQYAADDGAFTSRVAAIREGLDELGGGRILEYTLLEERLLIWVRSRDSVDSRSYPIPRNDLQEKVEQFLSLMRNLAGGDALDSLGRDLYDILVGPVADLLEGATSITIVPDRMLHRLPFAALRSPNDRYLIEDYVLVETLNAPYFLDLLAVDSPGRLVSVGSQEQNSSIRVELARLGEIYPDISSFDGVEVNRTLFLDAMNDASLFHYAGHSALDGSNSLSSSILLDGNLEGPNSVTASEIADRRLATNALVVLASCDSSVGNSIGGGGISRPDFGVPGRGGGIGCRIPVAGRKHSYNPTHATVPPRSGRRCAYR